MLKTKVKIPKRPSRRGASPGCGARWSAQQLRHVCWAHTVTGQCVCPCGVIK